MINLLSCSTITKKYLSFVLIYTLLTDFSAISGQVIVIFAALTVLSLLLDWLAGSLGVKKMGGSWAGMVGAFVGMIVGLMIPGAGLFIFIIAAFAGAVIFEMLAGKESRIALKAGLGSFIGFLAGTVIKFAIGVVMLVYFVWKVLIG